MKTSSLAALLSLTMALGIAAPNFAADSSSKPAAKVKVTTTAKTSSASTGTPMDTVVDGSLMVTRVGGVGAGVVLGTPVAILRDTYHHYTTWTPELADHVGGKDFAPSMALVSLVTAPAACVWGTLTGTYHGSRNGMMKGFNEPFNPESFSITKEYDE